MNINVEKDLEGYKEKLERIEVSEERLEQAIETGYQRARQEKKKLKQKKWWMSACLVAVLLIGFFTSIRVSSAFANYIADIPGMEKIVELIRHDKGMMTAIENDYYQEIGVSEKVNGIEIIIDGAIADENGLILFYTMKTEEIQTEIKMDKVIMTNKVGEEIDYASHSYGTPHYSEKGEKTFNGTIEYFFEEPFSARELQLDIEVKGEKFFLPFTLKGDFKVKKIHSIDQTVIVEGQKIHLLEVTIYPTRVAVHVKMDSSNTKRLLEFEDLRLVNENGEVWSKIRNGITASGVAEDETIYYLQSNYFNEPEKLYLAFNKIQAVDKEKSDVVIDTTKVEILQQPDGNRLRNLRIRGNDIIFNFYTEKEFPYGIFSTLQDGNGKNIDKASNFWRSFQEDLGYTELGISVPDLKNYENPISLQLYYYPEWIDGEKKIRIK